MLMKTIKRIFNQKHHFLLLFFMLAAIQYGFSTDLISYSLTSNANSSPLGGTFSYSSSLTNVSTFSSSGANAKGWNNANQYWAISAISTTGYHTIKVSAYMSSNTTGPKNFKLQYKIGAGSWTDFSGNAITLTITSSNFQLTLPAECANKSSVQVRWITSDTKDMNGNNVSSSTGISYIKTIRITGDLPVIPNSQTRDIGFVSITPTTITIDASPGNGDNRIAVINCVDRFVDPTNDQIFTASATYNYSSGDNPQVVYVGTGTRFTVTVPSSNNIYWIRYYEYNYNGSMTRYLTDTIHNSNPRSCALETIVTNDASAIRLTRATLGATISMPTQSAITERGIYWSLNPGVSDSDNKEIEGGTTGGDFTKLVEYLNRGTRIYFKGYVTNESGTILGNEKYFENIPIFTGTGNWNTAARWNVNEVPGANGDPTYGDVTDSPIIDGNCTLSDSIKVTDLTINATRNLTVSTNSKMQVEHVLLNNNGTSGILIKSAQGAATGSLVYASGDNIQASVQMYSKANYNLSNPTGSKYAWQYFGIPVTTLAYSPTFTNSYVRAWDESVRDFYDIWYQKNDGTPLMLNDGSNLNPEVAYELCQSSPKTYIFTGTLNHTDYSKDITYTAGAYYIGQNMLSNPYTAGMDIQSLSFTNAENSVYLYNTGTFNNWVANNGESTPGSGPGTYTVSTPGTAGHNGIQREIPPMQGFLVKSLSGGGNLSFQYSNLIKNTAVQRVKTSNTMVSTRIDVIGTNYNDRMWIFANENATDGFDNGYDGRKFLGFEGVSQLYGIGNDDIYQINVVKDLNNALIGFQPGTETTFKLKFNNENIESKYTNLYLVDMVANTITDITTSGSEYNFVSASTDPVNRFKIITSATDVKTIKDSESFNFYQTDENLIVINKDLTKGEAKIYNTMGKLMFSKEISADSQNIIHLSLSKGAYIVKCSNATQEVSKCIIIK